MALRPNVEVGLRHDGGDAESGAGADVGAGLTVSGRGLRADVQVRTLLVHEDSNFTERAVSVSISYNPTPSTPLGLTARLSPSWGGNLMGTSDLWSRELADISPQSGGQRIDADLGYGLSLGRLVATLRIGYGVTEWGRQYRLGWSLLEMGRLDASIDAISQQNLGVGVRGIARVAW